MFISKIAKIVLVFVSIFIAATEGSAKSDKTFDWGPLMDAITKVESKGDPNAKSGNCVGAMQIKPICVKARGEKKRYTLKDRYNVKKSREMFVIFMSKYNPTNDIEKAIRLWNGGIKYKVKSTQRYYQKVMAYLK